MTKDIDIGDYIEFKYEGRGKIKEVNISGSYCILENNTQVRREWITTIMKRKFQVGDIVTPAGNFFPVNHYVIIATDCGEAWCKSTQYTNSRHTFKIQDLRLVKSNIENEAGKM